MFSAKHLLKTAFLSGLILSASTFFPAPKALATPDSTPSTQAQGQAPCLVWTDPDVQPWACLLCVHGLGLANDAYTDFGKRMASIGVATYAIDVRGFGSWRRAQGHEKVDFKGCLSDIQGALKAIHQANPTLPVFLLGESMGGAIALQATALYPSLVDGLISAVPAGDRFKQKRTDLTVALHLLEGPNKQFDIGNSVVNQATDKPGLKTKWECDPLDRMNLSAKELIQFQEFMNQNHDRAKLITKTPVLMVQGGKDKLVKPEGTIELFNELATDDKDLVLVGGAEHLIFEDNQFNDEVIDIVTSFIDKHAASAPELSLAPDSGAPKDPVVAVNAPDTASNLPGSSSASKAEPASKTSPATPDCDPLVATVKSMQGVQKHTANQCSSAHLKLADMYMRNDHFRQAREHLHEALLHARDNNTCRQANKKMLELPAHVVAPNMGPETMQVSTKYGIVKGNAGPKAKPTVLSFCATWCEPCQALDKAIAACKSTYGDRVNFVILDADDPKNKPMLEEYNVSPIPTVLFLKPNGEVASYMVGFSGAASLETNIEKVL